LRKRRTSYLVVLAAMATFRYGNTRNLHRDKQAAINRSKQFPFHLPYIIYIILHRIHPA